MIENGIKIELLDSDEKNVLFVLELLKDQDYRISGLPMPLNADSVKSMLAGKEILSMGRQNGSGVIRFGIAVPCMTDKYNEFGLYGILFDRNMMHERPKTIAVSILRLRDYLFCQKLTKVGILMPQSPEMAEMMPKIRKHGFRQAAVWRSYFKTPTGFVDGVLLDIAGDNRKTLISDKAAVLSDLMPDKEKAKEAFELLPWLGMTEKQEILLAIVLQSPGKMHLDLASAGNIDRAYVSEICTLLSEKGLIIQVDNEQDCRMRHVYPVADMIIKQAKEIKNALPKRKLEIEEIQKLKDVFAEKMKAMGISFRKLRMQKMMNAIEILANRHGQIITVEILAKDLRCSGESVRDAVKVLAEAGMIRADFKGIAGKPTKIFQLILEEMPEAEIEPDIVIKKEVFEAPSENIPIAPVSDGLVLVDVTPEKIIPAESIVNNVGFKAEEKILLEKSNALINTINTICLKYGFCETQKVILIGLANAKGTILKINEVRNLDGVKKLNKGSFNSYLADLRSHKVIEIENQAVILRI